MPDSAGKRVLEPFEICSIRPPTENSSLSFKLTRGCYWNRCAFCPVYKTKTKFAKRSLDEVLADIARAKRLDDFMLENGLSRSDIRDEDDRLETIMQAIERCGADVQETSLFERSSDPEDSDDPLAWFQPWFKNTPHLPDSIQHLLSWRMAGGRTCFLGDADGLIVKPDFLLAVIHAVQSKFPTIERFTVYGRTYCAARLRSSADLRAYRAAGLDRVHFGVESGSDAVLSLMNKGETKADHVEGLAKARDAGLSCSIYVMPGLGGVGKQEEHVAQTAEVINQTRPDFVRLRTLQIFPGTPLEEKVRVGDFRQADESSVVREIRDLVAAINVSTHITSDSATNLVAIQGDAVSDRAVMLGRLDAYLFLDAREKTLYSFRARLASFIGQYGGLSPEIYAAIRPWIRHGRLEISGVKDVELRRAIELIRSRLMP